MSIAGSVLVRSRDRRSLTEFCASTGIDGLKIEEDAGTDYRLRVTCAERTPTDFIGAAVDDLDYDNFENRVASTRG